MPTVYPTHETVTFDGKRYRVERTAGYGGPGTLVERWPGIGVVGGIRAWRGHSWAKSVTWNAAVNPTGDRARGWVHVAAGRAGVAARSVLALTLLAHLPLDVRPVPAVAAAHRGNRRHQPALPDPGADRCGGNADAAGDLAGRQERLVTRAAFVVVIAHGVHASCGFRMNKDVLAIGG